MTIRELRPYQTEAVDSIRGAWSNGMTRPAIVLPTGTGKTDVIAKIATDAARDGKRVLALAHRGELLDQITERCRMHAATIPVGRVQASRNESRRPITVAMAQTLASPKRRDRLQKPDIVIVDECFPAGTLVGGVPIESIRTGDYVDSWDEVTGSPVRRRVTGTMRSRPSSLVKVLTNRGGVVCTPGHPFLTMRGWVCAIDLLHGEQVVSFTHDAARSSMHGMLSVGGAVRLEDSSAVPTTRAGVLLDAVSRCMGGARRGTAHGANEPAARIQAHDGTQPHAQSGSASEDVSDPEADQTQASHTGRQRHADACTATGTSRVSGVANGGDLSNRDRRTPLALQAGYLAPNDEGVRRGGRRVALLDKPSAVRRSARRTHALTRVVSVQVLEPGRDGTYGGVCPRGVVYNLEVEGTHTYRVGAAGLVAHNCHHAASPSYMDILGWAGSFDHTPTVGVTATMVRGDKRGLGDVWQEVVFSKDIRWAIKQGYLVPPLGKAVVVDHLDLTTAKVSQGDYQNNELGDMVSQDVDQIVQAWLKHADDRTTVAFTPNIESAQQLADEFRLNGIPTGEVYGSTSRTERDRTYAQLADGRIRILVSVMVQTEGWDCPPVSCILQARPTKLPGLYTQIVGRGLRTYPGKEDCLVLDVVGASRKQRLVTLIDLHPTAEYDTDELDRLPCEDCGCRPCACEPGERDPDGGRIKLLGPAEYEDVDFFAASKLNWLFTHKGTRFLPCGDRIAVLWPKDEGYLAGHRTSRGMENGRYVGMDGHWLNGALELEEARQLAEGWALDYDPSIASKGSSWRRGNQKPSDAQVKYATNLGIEGAEGMNKARISDEISIALASQVLDK